MKREELFGEKVIELRILEFKSGSNLYGIDIKDIGVLLWIKEYINENVNIVLAGKN